MQKDNTRETTKEEESDRVEKETIPFFNIFSPFAVLQNQLKMNSIIRQEEVKMIIDSVYTIVCGGKSGEVGSFLGKRDCNDHVRKHFFNMFLNSSSSEEIERIARGKTYTITFSTEFVDSFLFYMGLFILLLFCFNLKQK